LLDQARLPIRVEQDPARMRPSDMPYCVCDNTKFRKATGWQPTIPLEQSLRDVLDYWREQVAQQQLVHS